MTKSGRKKGSKNKSSSNSKDVVTNVRAVKKKSKQLKQKNVQKKHETKRKQKYHHISGKRNQSHSARQRKQTLSFAERKLPTASVIQTSVPWRLPSENSKRDTKIQPQIPSCLPYKNMVSDTALLQLDIELANFAEYVRLSAREINMRHEIISKIEKLLLSMWPHGKIQKFGSFATEEVCTFCSDVDLAFWGIVPTDDLHERDDWKDGSVIMSKESYKRTMNTIDRKEERVEAWKKLLDDVNFMGDLKEAKESAKDIKEEDSSTNESKCTPSEKKDSSDILAKENLRHVKDHSSLSSGSKRKNPEKSSNQSKNSNEVELNDDFFVIDRCGTKATPDSDESISNYESDSDDSIDKMTEYHRRAQSGKQDNRNDSENDVKDDFELNISQNRYTDFGAPASEISRPKIVNHHTRKKVVSALVKLGKKLWREPFAQNVQVRKTAKVPIICMTTRYGFDTDMALGGHNGMDTSHYVHKCVEKFKSFSTVVLFLKILLQHTDLDKPFTGGLGSYRLYVLVAKHFNEHNSLGGGMSAAEILISFFYRYSAMARSSSKGRTYIHKSYTIMSEDGEADLSAVNVDECIDIFHLSFQRLLDKLIDFDSWNGESKESLIACLIDAARLKRDRRVAMNKSNAFAPLNQVSKNDPGKITPSSKPVTHTFSKRPSLNSDKN